MSSKGKCQLTDTNDHSDPMLIDENNKGTRDYKLEQLAYIKESGLPCTPNKQYYQALQPSNFPFAGKASIGERTVKGSLESISSRQTGIYRPVDSKIMRNSINSRDSRTSVKGI